MSFGSSNNAAGVFRTSGKSLNQDTAVVATCQYQPGRGSVRILRDRESNGRPLTHRLDDEGQSESRHDPFDEIGRHALVDLELLELWDVETDRDHHLARSRLVHAQRRRQHPRTGVGHAEELEHPLHAPVLSQTAVKRIEHALETAVPEDVPRTAVEVDVGDVMAAAAERLCHLATGAQGHLALSRLASPQDGQLHFQRPTISTSGSIWRPNRRFTSTITRSIRRRTSAAVAPPSLTMKLPCTVDTTAAPSRAPFSPAAWTSRPAESPGGFLKTLPQFLVLMGWVSLRSLVSLAMSCLAASPSPRSSCTVAEITSAPVSAPSRSAEVR